MSSQEIIIEEGVLKGAILHSLWLRERLSGDEFVDPNNLQRLYEPSLLDENLLIDNYAIKDNFLSITFSDGVKGKINVDELYQEINSIDAIPKKKFGKKTTLYKYSIIIKFLKDSESLIQMLETFYEYGYVIIENTQAEENEVIKFC